MPEIVDRALSYLDGGAHAAEEPPPDVADALVAALLERGDVDGLGRLAAGGRPRLAKAARKGLHRLRSKGAKIEAPARATGPAITPLGEEPEARISSPDGAGERLVVFALPGTSGGWEHAHFRLSDELGVMESIAARGPRRILKDLIKRFEQSRVAFGQVPPARAVALVSDAYARTTQAGRAAPQGYAAAWGLLRSVGGGAGSASLPPPAASVDVAAVLALPDLATWAPPVASLRALEERVVGIDDSPLVLDEAQKADARATAVEQAVTQLATPEQTARLARRLRDAAEACHADARTADAAQLLALAARLERGVDASEPFLRGLMRRVLPPELADEARL